MNEKQTIKKLGKCSIKTGEYEKEGVKKNQYHNCGNVFYNQNTGNLSLKIDSLPTTGRNGWVNIFIEPDVKINIEEIKADEIDNIFE